jgi:hypothetical protein
MFRQEFGSKDQYCVRWDAFETKVDVVGSLSIPALDLLIETLVKARMERKDVLSNDAHQFHNTITSILDTELINNFHK